MSKLSSTVITEVRDWCVNGMLIPHEALRVMINPMTNMKIDSQEKFEMFKTWYCSVFYEIVVHHHHIEEEIYFPWIAKKVAFGDDRATSQHVELIEMMNNIKTKCGNNDMDGLSDMITKFARFMNEHLNEEEQMVPDMLRKSGYTPEEEQVVIGEIVKSLGPQGNALFLPIITHAMDLAGGYGPLNKEVFISGLPPFVQEAFPQFEESFKKDNLGVIEALMK